MTGWYSEPEIVEKYFDEFLANRAQETKLSYIAPLIKSLMRLVITHYHNPGDDDCRSMCDSDYS